MLTKIMNAHVKTDILEPIAKSLHAALDHVETATLVTASDQAMLVHNLVAFPALTAR